MKHTLKFSYPRRGLTGTFNTFRLGSTLATKCSPGDTVDLVDARTGKLLKVATVKSVHLGPLNVMAVEHAHSAHNWRDHPAEQQAELLKTSMSKRYPPGRVHDTSSVTVIYLEETPCTPCPTGPATSTNAGPVTT